MIFSFACINKFVAFFIVFMLAHTLAMDIDRNPIRVNDQDLLNAIVRGHANYIHQRMLAMNPNSDLYYFMIRVANQNPSEQSVWALLSHPRLDVIRLLHSIDRKWGIPTKYEDFNRIKRILRRIR